MVLGGTVPFPWVMDECDIRCQGGVALMEAQHAFVQVCIYVYVYVCVGGM